MNSKVLIVWGMHRSGTSMLASWLAACGLDIGKELLGAGLGNERGHYEDTDFLGLHERILRDNKIHCGGLSRVGPLRLKPHFFGEMKTLVDKKSKGSPQWGWKEPRTCLFYKEYAQLVPDALHLVVYRDYRLVVDSLVRRKLGKFQRRNAKRAGLKFRYYQFGIFLWQKFIMERVAGGYLEAWLRYNENLIELIATLGNGKFFMMNCKDFVSAGESVIKWMESAGFNLTDIDPGMCAEPSLLTGKTVYAYKFKKASLSRAESVYANLKRLSFNCVDND